MTQAVNTTLLCLLKSFVFLITSISSFSSLSVETQAAAKPLTNQNHLVVVTEHLPPFQYLEDGEVRGFATDIIRKVLTQLPFEYEITLYPWSRAYNLVLNRENTCIYSIARTPEREDSFIWIDNFAQRNVSFIGLTENTDIQVNSIEDAKKYRVAVIRDDVNHQLLLSHGFTEAKNLFVVNNSYSMLKLLKQRKDIDLILADPFTINYRAKMNLINSDDFKSFFQVNKTPLNYYFACHLDTDAKIIDTLKDRFKFIKNSGEITKIKQKWQFN